MTRWQVYFFIGFFRHGAGSMLKLHHTFNLYRKFPWDQTSKLYSGRVSCYTLIKHEEELGGVPEDEVVPEHIHAKYYVIQQ